MVYRYCHPPPDLKSSNQPPLAGHTTLEVQKGQVVGGTAQTDDQIVAAYFGNGSIGVIPGATGVTVTIAPVCGDSLSPPSAGIVKGNVYAIQAVEQPSGQPAVAIHPLRVVLSYPPGPFTDIEFHDSSGWHQLTTITVSSQSAAQADLMGFGQFAAVGPPGRESLLTALVHLVESFGLLAFILVFGAIAVVQELRRRRRKA